ncbi:MAG: hypothetical protein IJA47_03615 [Oscillospiraceae bacterium]|nr:hypothetical protein [Oscillospiraceae bacterium]
MVYIVTYDLNNPGQNYENVIQAIKDASTGVWCTFWKSSFLIKSNYQTAQEVFDRIKPHLDKNDRCLVIECTSNMQGWLSNSEWDYIKDNILG